MHALAVSEQGTRLHLVGDTLLVQRGKDVLRRVRLGEINEVLLLGQVELSTAAVAALARRNIDVVFLTAQGWFRARLVGPASQQAALRLAQLRRALDAGFALGVARAMVAGKITHQRQILLRAQRRLRAYIHGPRSMPRRSIRASSRGSRAGAGASCSRRFFRASGTLRPTAARKRASLMRYFVSTAVKPTP